MHLLLENLKKTKVRLSIMIGWFKKRGRFSYYRLALMSTVKRLKGHAMSFFNENHCVTTHFPL